MHFPSFVVGSLASASTFLLVHQQLSHRERLTKKWPLAEKAENELRAQFESLKSQIKSQKALAGFDESSFGTQAATKYYKQALDTAYNFFGRKD